MTEPFNPLDMRNLGESLAQAMLSREATPLAQIPTFYGAGIYAIYYTGALPMYELLRQANEDGQFAQPIYVGKAVPQGARRGVLVATATRALSGRLRQHRLSIEVAGNLNVEDFQARWLVTEPIWIPLGESLLISRTAPVWNTIVDGFGNHDPGSGRFAGRVPRWDVLHPGRPWASSFVPRNETADDIELDVREYLRQRLQV